MSSFLSYFLAYFLFIGSLIAYHGSDPEADQYFPLQGDFAASHILIAYKGADRAKAEVTRNKKEALAKANKLTAVLAKDPTQFENLAREESDGSTARVSGNLKSFNKGSMAPAFERALANLEIGAITAKPVKTPFGYHIIRRNSPQVKYYCARAVLTTHREAVKVRGIPQDSAAYQRGKEQALAAIKEISAQITRANFDEVLNKQGDLERGFLGVFKLGDSTFSEKIIETIKDLKYGDISEVVDLPFGYAILQRVKVEKRSGSRIWISYAGAAHAPNAVTRTREQAEILANELCQKLDADPELFTSLAKEHSNGPFKVRGGLMPPWFVGYQDPEIERAIESLSAEEIAAKPIETDKGFFIVRRHAFE